MHRRGGKEVFHGNKEVVELINSVQFDWDKIVETLIDFLNNGAGNMLSSTLTAAKSIISGVSTFVIAFLFAIYILRRRKSLGYRRKRYCLHSYEEVVWRLWWKSLPLLTAHFQAS